jgi:hypothetical protein
MLARGCDECRKQPVLEIVVDPGVELGFRQADRLHGRRRDQA